VASPLAEKATNAGDGARATSFLNLPLS